MPLNKNVLHVLNGLTPGLRLAQPRGPTNWFIFLSLIYMMTKAKSIFQDLQCCGLDDGRSWVLNSIIVWLDFLTAVSRQMAVFLGCSAVYTGVSSPAFQKLSGRCKKLRNVGKLVPVYIYHCTIL
jgi:hypothetical protein